MLKQHVGQKCMLGRAAVHISQYVSPLVVNASVVALFHNQHSKTHMYRPYNDDRNDMLTANRLTSTSITLLFKIITESSCIFYLVHFTRLSVSAPNLIKLRKVTE